MGNRGAPASSSMLGTTILFVNLNKMEDSVFVFSFSSRRASISKQEQEFEFKTMMDSVSSEIIEEQEEEMHALELEEQSRRREDMEVKSYHCSFIVSRRLSVSLPLCLSVSVPVSHADSKGFVLVASVDVN